MTKSWLLRVARLVYTFYTFRAIIIHIGYLLGVFPNSSIIAIIVLIVSQFLFWVRPCYVKKHNKRGNFLSEFLLHRVPFLLFFISGKIAITNAGIVMCVATIVIYIICQWGPRELIKIYRDNEETWNTIMYPKRYTIDKA